jgi:hypothetical protein
VSKWYVVCMKKEVFKKTRLVIHYRRNLKNQAVREGVKLSSPREHACYPRFGIRPTKLWCLAHHLVPHIVASKTVELTNVNNGLDSIYSEDPLETDR